MLQKFAMIFALGFASIWAVYLIFRSFYPRSYAPLMNYDMTVFGLILIDWLIIRISGIDKKTQYRKFRMAHTILISIPLIFIFLRIILY